MKRTICLLLAVALLLPCLGIQAEAVMSGECGSHMTWTFDPATGVLRISGTGEMWRFDTAADPKYSTSPWHKDFYKISSIRTVIIEEGVTRIGSCAFRYCGNLTNVILPSTLTRIEQEAFYACSSLKNLVLPEKLEYIGESAFGWCRSLKNLVFPEKLKYIGKSAFKGCISLKSLNIPGSAADIQRSAFSSCSDLTELIIGEGITRLDSYVFEDCTSLTRISFPASMKLIFDAAFYGCNAISDVYYPWYAKELTINQYNDKLFEAMWHTDHIHNFVSEVTPPTCDKIGYTTYVCSGCDSSYIGNATELIDHSFGEWVETLAPTCIAVGSEQRECSSCGHSESREVDMLDHAYTPYVYDPTCVAFGYTVYICDSCRHEVITDMTEPTGHSYEQEIIESTCTEGGCVIFTCTNCNESVVTEEFIPAGHSYGDWILTKAPDVGVEGEERRDCVDCEHFETRSVEALGISAPTVSISVNTVTGKPKISWTKVEGAEKYRIYRSTKRTSGFSYLKSAKTATSFTDTSAEAGVNYYYKIKAYHVNGVTVSDWSNTVSRVCDLPAPTVTISGNTTTGKPIVKWATVDGAEKYIVYRYNSKSSGYEKVYTAVTARSYTDKNAVAGNNYYYKVMAVHSNASANSAYSAVVNRVCDLAKPVVSITLYKNDPRLTWDKVDGAQKYYVYRATSKDGEYTKVKTTKTATSFTDTTAKAKTKYYYKVKAIHENTSANSAFSSIKYITAK